MDLTLILNSLLLGVGLAMDAFSVSLANGLNEPTMSNKRLLGISGVFAFLQGLMPLLGWICIHTVLEYFEGLQRFIPWIALILLCYIGGKMLYDGFTHCADDGCKAGRLGLAALLVQGIATSIDALSVGFTIADYDLLSALECALIIAAVTLIICAVGVEIGKRAGTRLAGKAGILGGVILIAIGLEIFITGVF